MGINNVPDAAPWLNTHFVLPYGLRLQQKVGQATITNVVDAGATVVYTADNNYSAGNIVSIYGVNPVAYDLQRATILSATSTTFTITSAATGTYVSGGTAQRTGEIAVTIPTGITFVYAITVGGGSGGFNIGGGGAGGVAWGWTIAPSTCLIGASGGSGSVGSATRYGNIMAGGGFNGLGSAGVGANSTTDAGISGTQNYWGIPGGGNTSMASNLGVKGQSGSGAGGGSAAFTNGNIGGAGGDGISGGGGGRSWGPGAGTNTGGAGGNGLVGGGGGAANNTSGTRTGGTGGNGYNILTGAITTGGAGTTGTNTNGAGGGGGGIAGNGFAASGTTGGQGGLGGGAGGGQGVTGGSPVGTGGSGGAGVLYLFY